MGDIEMARGVPGPGAYNAVAITGTEGAKSTILSRRPDTSQQLSRNLPGPGAYESTYVRRKSPAYKYAHALIKCRVGTASRGRECVDALLNPGPGAYNPVDKQVSQKKKSPGWA